MENKSLTLENKNIEKQYLLEPSNKAIAFFCLFSRYEYALKKAGFFQKGATVKASWDKFSEEFNADFFEYIKDDNVCAYLFKHPPKIQKKQNNSIVWVDVDKNCPFELVNVVRNNLFHGGKNDLRVERDINLINSCISILNYAYSYLQKKNEEPKEQITKFLDGMNYID